MYIYIFKNIYRYHKQFTLDENIKNDTIKYN